MTIGHIEVELIGDFAPLVNDGRDFDALLDDLMDCLLACDVTDPTISFSAAARGSFEGTLGIEMFLDEVTPEGITSKGMAALRTAFHTVGAATPGWENLIDSMIQRFSTERLNEDDLALAGP